MIFFDLDLQKGAVGFKKKLHQVLPFPALIHQNY